MLSYSFCRLWKHFISQFQCCEPLSACINRSKGTLRSSSFIRECWELRNSFFHSLTHAHTDTVQTALCCAKMSKTFFTGSTKTSMVAVVILLIRRLFWLWKVLFFFSQNSTLKSKKRNEREIKESTPSYFTANELIASALVTIKRATRALSPLLLSAFYLIWVTLSQLCFKQQHLCLCGINLNPSCKENVGLRHGNYNKHYVIRVHCSRWIGFKVADF